MSLRDRQRWGSGHLHDTARRSLSFYLSVEGKMQLKIENFPPITRIPLVLGT